MVQLLRNETVRQLGNSLGYTVKRYTIAVTLTEQDTRSTHELSVRRAADRLMPLPISRFGSGLHERRPVFVFPVVRVVVLLGSLFPVVTLVAIVLRRALWSVGVINDCHNVW